jgi:hypothetical protein
MSAKYKHPLITELAANPAAAVRTMASVLEMAEHTGLDFAGVVWPSDPRRPAVVYGALMPSGLFAGEEVPNLRALLGAGQATLHQLIRRDELAAGVLVELEEWRARAVAAETEVARLRILPGGAGLVAEVGGSGE